MSIESANNCPEKIVHNKPQFIWKIDKNAPHFLRSDKAAIINTGTKTDKEAKTIALEDTELQIDQQVYMIPQNKENFKIIQAKITEPNHVTSTWASGSQNISGYVGILDNKIIPKIICTAIWADQSKDEVTLELHNSEDKKP